MNNRNTFTGVLFVGIGILLLLSNLGWLSGVWFLFALSLAFLTAYFLYSRSLGFIIPGLLVGALALYAHLGERTGGLSPAFFFFFFAAAFFGVYVIHTMHLSTTDRGERIWPIFPGTALLAVGILVYSIENDFFGIRPFRYLNYIFPVLLIAYGLKIVLVDSRKKKLE